MVEKDIKEKKEWIEPTFEKGELVNQVTFTAGSKYGNPDKSGCGLFKKIIILGQCLSIVSAPR
jgi:hypothetical protein